MPTKLHVDSLNPGFTDNLDKIKYNCGKISDEILTKVAVGLQKSDTAIIIFPAGRFVGFLAMYIAPKYFRLIFIEPKSDLDFQAKVDFLCGEEHNSVREKLMSAYEGVKSNFEEHKDLFWLSTDPLP